MILTTKARYAIISCIDIAKMILEKKDYKVSVYEIAQKQHISESYLEQIFFKLKNANILISKKGPSGGYCFTKETKDIKLIEIISAVNENIKMTDCDECRSTNRINGSTLKCDSHFLWKALSGHINDFFEKITLDDVLNHNIKI